MKIRYEDTEYETYFEKDVVMAFKWLLSDYLVGTNGIVLVNDLVFVSENTESFSLSSQAKVTSMTTKYCTNPRFYLKQGNQYKRISKKQVQVLNRIDDLKIIDFGTRKAKVEEDMIAFYKRRSLGVALLLAYISREELEEKFNELNKTN